MVSKLRQRFILFFLLSRGAVLFAEKAPINIDGRFEDWELVEVAASDVGDTNPSAVDFGRLWIAEDNRHLFIRIETGVVVDPSENNNLILYVDGGSGRELEWQLGNRTGVFRVNGSITNNDVRYTDIGFRCIPTLDTHDLEMALRLDARPDGSTPLLPGSEVHIRFENASGDRIPDSGTGVSYVLGSGSLPEDPIINFDKQRTTDLRVATYNILNDNLFVSTLQPGFRRQLQAVQPDVIHFQEIRNATVGNTLALIESWLPLENDKAWHAVGGSTSVNDTITVSRFPIQNRWDLYGSNSISGNIAMVLDTASEMGSLTFMVNAHLPSGANDVARQQEVDVIMAFLRGAKQPTGTLTLAQDTPIIFAGDMNLVGRTGQLTTLLTGDISNNALNGADFMPDWDATPLTSITPRHSDQRMGYTWRNDTENNYWPGHLDYIIYSDSTLDIIQSFVVHTPSMSSDRLQQYGLQTNDSLGADHLLFVADFRPAFVDRDQNGLPDFWETLVFGGTGMSDATTDTDFDGLNNLQEFQFGTNPKDKNSTLKVSLLSFAEDGTTIQWKTVEDRNYQLQASNDLNNWMDITDPILGNGQIANRTIPASQTNPVFFRILVF